MIYRYETTSDNYEDYASGRVLFNAPGAAPFPVRLGSEIFLRCKAMLRSKGQQPPYTLYDPFCGSGYLLTVLGLRHTQDICRLLASDINASILPIARRNLELLQPAGMESRIAQLTELYEQYGKESHQQALLSARKLQEIVTGRKADLPMDCFQADATKLRAFDTRLAQVDVVIADLPYGKLTDWQSDAEPREAAVTLLEGLAAALPGHAVIAVVADKGQQLRSEQVRRLERFNAGKRQVALFEIIT